MVSVAAIREVSVHEVRSEFCGRMQDRGEPMLPGPGNDVVISFGNVRRRVIGATIPLKSPVQVS